MSDDNINNVKETLEESIRATDIDASVTSNGNNTFIIKDFCQDGGIVTAICFDDGSITLFCDKHPDSENDISGSSTQSSKFISFMNSWMEEHNYDTLNSNRKGQLFEAYYSAHPEVVQKLYRRIHQKAGYSFPAFSNVFLVLILRVALQGEILLQ